MFADFSSIRQSVIQNVDIVQVEKHQFANSKFENNENRNKQKRASLVTLDYFT